MHQYIHCNDNSKRHSKEKQGNKLYKTEPILKMDWENCTKIEREVNQSIDKQILLAKISHGGIRQCNPKNGDSRISWDLVKVESCMILFYFLFLVHGLKVWWNCKKHYQEVKIKIVFWQLVLHFRFTVTIERNKNIKYCNYLYAWIALNGCPIVIENELNKQERGSGCYMVELNSGITVLRCLKNCNNMCWSYRYANHSEMW